MSGTHLRNSAFRILILATAVIFASREADGARVALEGLNTYTAAVSGALSRAGHVPVALTAAQVETGALLTGRFDVLVIGRNSIYLGVSALYVSRVGEYVAAGGNIVTELSGASIFFSGYASDVTPLQVTRAPQLKVFDAILHAGALNASGTPISLADRTDPVASGLSNPFSDPYGSDYFHWIESVDPSLHLVGQFTGADGWRRSPADRPCLAW